MKSTVINNGNENNPPSDDNNKSNNQPPQPQQRRHPFYPECFDMDDPYDFFKNPALRARLNRMRDPWSSMAFGAPRKRRNSLHDSDKDETSHDTRPQYQDDDDDFFSPFEHNWEGSWPRHVSAARKRAQQPQPQASNHGGHAGFFDHIPSEFLHYIPEGFGFPRMHHEPPRHKTTATFNVPQFQPQPTMYPENVRQSPPQTTRPADNRPKYCDAAMQTEELSGETPTTPTGETMSNLQQHGLRNTVDLGQRSAQEERAQRAHSAPPPSDSNESPNNSGTQSAPSFISANASSFSSSQPGSHTAETSTSTQGGPGAKASATASAGDQYSRSQAPRPQQQTPPSQSQHQRQHSEGSGVRHVPIIIEGSNDAPAVRKDKPSQPTPPEPPKRGVPLAAQQQKPQQQQQQQQYQQQQPQPQQQQKQQQPQYEEEDEASNSQAPPSAESINKIQQIQKDVLELMFQVEQFNGNTRKDKQYIFLDEMLTRNLLKLDLIDTQGNDSIRLARKEAIKCIQASLSVLEAKADGGGKMTESESQTTTETPADSSTQTAAANSTSTDNSTKETETISTPSKEEQVVEEEAAIVLDSHIPIPLPDANHPIVPTTATTTTTVPDDVKSDGEHGKQSGDDQTVTKTEKPKKKKIIKKVKPTSGGEQRASSSSPVPQSSGDKIEPSASEAQPSENS